VLNGDLALQDAYDISAVPPSGYDRMYLMVYRGSVLSAGGFDPGSGYVASYFRDMQRYFPGARGQVSIGLGGEAPYDDLDTLVNDVRMLAGLGATRIPVYSLETTVEGLGASGVRSIVQAGRNPLTGAELEAAATPPPVVLGIRAGVARRDATAGALTQSVTGEHDDPRPPNSYPNGCGDLSTQPRRQTR